jgi:hypothetical protein
LVGEGTPEDIARAGQGYTSRYLAEKLGL